MRFRQWILAIVTGILLTQSGFAQERCGFDLLQEKRRELHPGIETQFEDWMSAKIRRRQGMRTMATFTVPVVVHIIHNGEPIGSGLNLSVAQIESQIQVLNDDYQRLNADRINTPAEFDAVAGSVDLEFVLARQDPEGLPSDGIVRLQGTKPDWSVDNAGDFKALSYWPAEDYLNIWVVALTGDYLGFAQFPETELPGVQGPYGRLTDGVVIDYRVFGTIDAGDFNLDPKYSKGRTATHEIGHFLGLVHIFGNQGGCSTTDFVDDTPVQSSATLNCPSHPAISCSQNKMFQNFLDYTDDVCMNLFTAGQIVRVITVLENSPRRASLNVSQGLQAPVVLTLDLEARRVVAPLAQTCGQQIVPAVELRNRGSSVVSSAEIQLLINGAVTQTKTFTLNMDALDLATVSFDAIDLPEPSLSVVSFQILEVNGGTDDDSGNNEAEINPAVSARNTVPFTETFNSTPAGWQILNPDNEVTWGNTLAPAASPTNRAMFMAMYNYKNTGSKDRLVSGSIEIPPTGAPVLKFDRAYAPFSNNNNDVLRVFVSSGCSADLSQAVEIFNKSGTELATAPQTSAEFVPTGPNQWATESISLIDYRGENIQLIFETTNGFSNNLYIDNVSVSASEFNDVAVVALSSPGPVFCVTSPSPVIQVQNLGSAIVSRVNVSVVLNGNTIANQLFQNLDLVTGASTELTLPAANFAEGENTIQFTITNPDVSTEESPDNNTLIAARVLNTDTYHNPLRINLDNGVPLSIVSQGFEEEWETTTTNFDNSLVYRAWDNPGIDQESWAVTPTIDFSGNTEAGMFFSTSYGKRTTGDERLRVMVSEDCGLHYNSMLADLTGSLLSNQDSNTAPWVPVNQSDWTTHYIGLTPFAGKDQVRFAFVVTNGHGNNLYLDNMEWFVEDDPYPTRIEEFYSVYSSEFEPYEFFITFNLEQKETARLAVYNTMGQALIDNQLPETLNQTYEVDLTGQSTGIYIVRLQAGNLVSTTKVFIGQ
jgi:archaellum component FlaF (FlaF/FlaG flagellin family)